MLPWSAMVVPGTICEASFVIISATPLSFPTIQPSWLSELGLASIEIQLFPSITQAPHLPSAAVPLAGLARKKNIVVRFIELMPLGAAAALQLLSINEVVSLIEREYGPMTPSSQKLGNGPALYYTLSDFEGYIGLISAISQGFCHSCNRLRLTASGILKPCLSSDLSLDLRRLIRGPDSDEEIIRAIRNLVEEKPAGHSFGGVNEKRDHGKKEMFRIGG